MNVVDPLADCHSGPRFLLVAKETPFKVIVLGVAHFEIIRVVSPGRPVSQPIYPCTDVVTSTKLSHCRTSGAARPLGQDELSHEDSSRGPGLFRCCFGEALSVDCGRLRRSVGPSVGRPSVGRIHPALHPP